MSDVPFWLIAMVCVFWGTELIGTLFKLRHEWSSSSPLRRFFLRFMCAVEAMLFVVLMTILVRAVEVT